MDLIIFARTATPSDTVVAAVAADGPEQERHGALNLGAGLPIDIEPSASDEAAEFDRLVFRGGPADGIVLAFPRVIAANHIMVDGARYEPRGRDERGRQVFGMVPAPGRLGA